MLPVIIVVSLLTCFADAVAVVTTDSFESFVLAIAHFDPDHDVGIKPESRETAFMRAVLRQARKDVPALKDIHVCDEQIRGGPQKADRYRAFEVEIGVEHRREDPAAWADSLAALCERIVGGCRFSNRVTRESTARRGVSVTRSTFYGIGSRYQTRKSHASCGNLEVLEWLRADGIDSILHEESWWTSTDRRYGHVWLEFAYLTDTEHAIEAFRSAPMYPQVFAGFEVVPFRGALIGDGDEIKVVERPECDGFNGVVLDFSCGWGDCPAGCMHRHQWVVEYRCSNPEADRDWQLVGGLVEERGSPLPDPDRELELIDDPIEVELERLNSGLDR